MPSFRSRLAVLVTLSALAVHIPARSIACSSCGCMLNTNWDSQGYVARPGVRLDVRYDDINQTELRAGTHRLNRGDISLPAEREIEQATRNRNATWGVDYAPDARWGFNAQLPLIDRTHTTVAEGDTDVSGSKTSRPGDARLTGRYQGFLPGHNLGVQAGLKLPTGAFHDVFRGGPEAGAPLDRGLQAGTGTTDLLLGVYHFLAFSPDWGYFAQGSWQQPLNAREEFRPGASWIVTTGLRCTAWGRIVPQLQLSGKADLKDRGDQADRPNSGGTVLYVSPGVSVGVTPKLNLFGFLQAPAYQNVDGYQLVPKATFSLGLRYTI